jgi:hypothetical protein
LFFFGGKEGWLEYKLCIETTVYLMNKTCKYIIYTIIIFKYQYYLVKILWFRSLINEDKFEKMSKNTTGRTKFLLQLLRFSYAGNIKSVNIFIPSKKHMNASGISANTYFHLLVPDSIPTYK